MSIVNHDLPGVRVIRGAPDDLELVALVAGLASTTTDDAPEDAPASTPVWGRDRGIRGARPYGLDSDAWRWSTRR